VRWADFARDLDLLGAARRATHDVIDADPALTRSQHAAYRTRILQRYERGFELFRVW